MEVFNSSALPQAIGGWRLSGGIGYTFQAGASIPAGGRLVVVANAAAFSARYPAVTNFVGAWTGQLSNASDTITLRDAANVMVCEVTYADDGDWGERRRNLADHGHRGWVWASDADGGGKSLELIQPTFEVDEGQNWATSAVLDGTPGAANSVASANLPCIIDKVGHFPLVPRSSDVVAVNCRVRDDLGLITSVTLHFRTDGSASFTTMPMADDGAHGDALAGDGIFGSYLPPASDGTRVEFYVSASDDVQTRAWPAPARNYTGALEQSQNCIYQVDNKVYSGAMPLYRIIMRDADAQELAAINANTGVPPFPFNPGEAADQTHSHARFNATFISLDGTGQKVRYLAGVRNRGNGSRTATPPNYNVHFSNDDRWNERTALVLNSQNTPYQLLGSTLFRKAGLPGAESRAVRLRVNHADPTGGSAVAPTYGFYACNEFLDGDFVDHHFPLNNGGNIYRGQRIVTGFTAGGTDLDGAHLRKIVPAPAETLSLPELYAMNFRKETNAMENNWSDLIALTGALARGSSGTAVNDPTSYESDYVSAVESVADVRQWMRWLAVNTLADNEETNLSNGDGDDYYLYFGETDSRAALLHHDLDTVLGRSATANSATHGIFRMCDAPDGSPTPLNPFMKHPAFAPMYYEELQRLLDGPFLPSNFEDLCDQMLAPVVGASLRTTVKSFNSTRHAYISSLIPRTLTVSAVQAVDGSTLAPVNGYPQTIASQCKLVGFAPAIATRSVQVNRAAAEWSAWEAKWTAPTVPLSPGVNRVLVQAFDGAGVELARTWQDVWYFDGTDEVRSGTLAGSETWSAANSPYRIAGNMTVPSGATLTIQPGTVVMSVAGAEITIASGGALVAEGTAVQPLRFMSLPGGGTWDGISVNGVAGSPPTRISHAHISGNTAEAIEVQGGEVFLDHVTFGNPTQTYLELSNASFVVTNCVFSAATTAFEMVKVSGTRVGGKAVFRGCYFGKTIGPFDTIDAANIQRPGPILYVVDNVFTGSDEDILDLDNTDAWVEGNIFIGAHRNGTTENSSAVSGGGGGSEVTLIGNIFARCDQVAEAMNGNFLTLLNNTVVDEVPATAGAAIINFLDPGTTAGAGMVLEGNLIYSPVPIARNLSGASTVTLNNNLLSAAWTGAGGGNVVTGALLAGPLEIPTPEPWNYQGVSAEIRARVKPIAQSPARRTGPNGTDKGATRPRGVSLSGLPTTIANSGSAVVAVGTLMQGSSIPTTASAFPQGSGWTHYAWRLNGGAWSAETPLAQSIVLSGLADGEYHLEVVGKTDGGSWQDDAALGGAATQATWTVQASYVPPSVEAVWLNEVMALNTETLLFGTVAPDLIELRNAGGVAVDLSGWGMTDNAALPFKYTFPAGTSIEAGGFLIVHATDNVNVSTPRTGFALKRGGDSLRLTRGNGTSDVISFGRQLADYSIGRAADGSWALCKPTFGAATILAERGPLTDIVINEWLAAAAVLAANDFVELHNRSTYPADVGGCFLTDNPADWPTRHAIRALTFIEPGRYAAFDADGKTNDGPEHLGFKLDPLQGELGFLSPTLGFLDNVVYGPQRSDISEGLTPNGAGSVATFNQPTPGGPNPAVAGTTSSTTTNLVPLNQAWRYFVNGTSAPPLDGSNSFTAPGYNEDAWAPAAQQLLYIETAALNNADGFTKSSVLPGITSTRPQQTYYFRAHFTYNGPLSGVSLTAKVMCDDGANIYLNGGSPTPIRMNAGATAYADRANASVGDATVQTISIPASDLVIGDNVLAVSVHQANVQTGASPSSDIVWGMKLDITVTTTFPVVPVVLNEVLVSNTALQNPDGSYAGWAEIINPTALPIDIGDMSLSDDVAAPRKFIFPSPTLLAAGERHIVQFNPLTAPSPTNTGWALSADGGTLGFYHIPANAGALHDSIAFGRQIPNFAVGRVPDADGAWTLTVPSRAGLNVAAALGQANDVKFNEWRSDANDFFELRNGGTLPVDIGGNYLTDKLSQQFQFPIPPLSFVGTSGNSRWQAWTADGAFAHGHVNFSLLPTDSLAFSTAAGVVLDVVPTIGSQPAGSSAGRFPEGSTTVITLVPTPGTANQAQTVDSDGDGLPDDWELANGMNPNSAADATADSDGDGQSNLAEYLAGTNPHSSADVFKAELTPPGPSGPIIRFTAIAEKTYTVQYKTTLTDPTWQRVGDVSAQGSTAIVEVPDPAGATAGQRFYRIVTPAVP